MPKILEIERLSFKKPYTPQTFIFMHAMPNSLFLVAVKDSDVVAYALATVSGTNSELVSIATHPAHRLKGVATALWRRLASALKRRGVQRVALHVRRGNVSAQAFYATIGFVKVGEVPRYYKDEDAIRMARAL